MDKKSYIKVQLEIHRKTNFVYVHKYGIHMKSVSF